MNYPTPKCAKKTALILLLGMAGLVAQPVPSVHGAVVGDSRWLVEKGDSVYAIARKVFPGDADKQRRFRKELVEQNPDVFQGDMNRLSIGQTLLLPAFAVSRPVESKAGITAGATAPVVGKQPEPSRTVRFAKVPAKPVTSRAESKAVTADPEEIIGQVVISVGGMSATNRGTERSLKRRSPILRGDTIATADRTYTQIRMKDGALISLRPKTRLRIVDYRFNGTEDGSERSFMELLAGGFRTITGYIGHINRQNYRVKTPVATIGIRGTHYGLMACVAGSCEEESPDLEDGVYGGVVDGSIVVENESGATVFNNDQYFHVASISSAPVEQLVPPPVFHGKADARAGRKPAHQDLAGAGEEADQQQLAEDAPGLNTQRIDALGPLVKNVIDDLPPNLLPDDKIKDEFKSDADNPILDPELIDPENLPEDIPLEQLAPAGSGILVALNTEDPKLGVVDTTAAGVLVGVKGQIVLGTLVEADGSTITNLPIAINEVSQDSTHDLILPSGVAGISDIGGNPIGVNWGRWSDNYVFLENGVEQPILSDVHYVYSDKLTTPAELEMAQLGGLTANELYTFAGGTTPTNLAGNAVELGFIEAEADFINGKLNYYHVHVIDGGASLDMKAADIGFDVMNEFQLQDSVNLGGSGCSGVEVCTGRASAAFVGSQAEGMITTYSVKDESSNAGGNGAALLIREGSVVQTK